MFMIKPQIYIARAKKSENGSGFDVEGGLEIQKCFPGAYYKKAEGLEAYGKTIIYEEDYPEESFPDICFPDIPEEAKYEKTDFTLTLYFFDPDKHEKEAEEIMAIDRSYHAFVEYITGSFIKYWDNVRHRKIMLTFSGGVKPVKDTLYGIIYKEVDFKFTNIYGKSFKLDEPTSW